MQGKDKVSQLGFVLRMRVAEQLTQSEPYYGIRAALAAAGLTEEAMPSDASFRAYRETEEYQFVHRNAIRAERLEMSAATVDADLEKLEKVCDAAAYRVLWRDLDDETLTFEQRLQVLDRLQRLERTTLSGERLELSTQKFDYRKRHRDHDEFIRILGLSAVACRMGSNLEPGSPCFHVVLAFLRGTLGLLQANEPEVRKLGGRESEDFHLPVLEPELTPVMSPVALAALREAEAKLGQMGDNGGKSTLEHSPWSRLLHPDDEDGFELPSQESIVSSACHEMAFWLKNPLWPSMSDEVKRENLQTSWELQAVLEELQVMSPADREMTLAELFPEEPHTRAVWKMLAALIPPPFPEAAVEAKPGETGGNGGKSTQENHVASESAVA
jgi:hypothetical protein